MTYVWARGGWMYKPRWILSAHVHHVWLHMHRYGSILRGEESTTFTMKRSRVWALLADVHCSNAQGFRLVRPIPATHTRRK
jgi:hypothetical protein